MPNHNAENEGIKRRYFAYLKEPKRRGEPSLDAAKALRRLESNLYRPFKTFHIEQAIAFKRPPAEQSSLRTGKPLSRATRHSTLAAVRAFFLWLAGQQGYRSRLAYSDAQIFSDPEWDALISVSVRPAND